MFKPLFNHLARAVGRRRDYSIADAAGDFQSLHGLAPFNIFHDSCHVATGFGIGINDEERIRVYEATFWDGYSSRSRHTGHREYMAPNREMRADFVIRAAEKTRKVLFAHYHNEGSLNVSDSLLAGGTAFGQIQLATDPVSVAEIEEHFSLAKRIRDAIRKETGCWFWEHSEGSLGALPAKLVDAQNDAWAIKERHMTDKNRVAEEAQADLFRARVDDFIAEAKSAVTPWEPRDHLVEQVEKSGSATTEIYAPHRPWRKTLAAS